MSKQMLDRLVAKGAPDKNDGRIIKQALMRHLLDQMSARPFFQKNFVFQGGSTLHLVYSSPRTSFDIDYVWVRNPSNTDMDDALGQFSSIARHLEGYPVTFTPKKTDGTFMRVAYAVEFSGSFKPSVSVEGVFAPPILPLASHQTPYGEVLVETPREIMLDKIVASLNRMESRGLIKGSDTYDLFFIHQAFGPFTRPDEITKKAETYRSALPTSLWPDLVRKIKDDIAARRAHIEASISRQLPSPYLSAFSFERMFAIAQEIFDRVAEIGRI